MTDCHPLLHRLARGALRNRALDFSTPPITLGKVTLLPHQVAAVHWLIRRINAFGGALLADPPGLGKTFVALAVAHAKATRPLVIAPASLRGHWGNAASQTGVDLDFVSTERLSAPAPLSLGSYGFVIIDEAHHLRTPSTRRHQRTASLCSSAEVLLLSATPIHNRASDLEHITTLFHLPITQTSARLLRRQLTLRRSLSLIQAADARCGENPAIPAVCFRRALCVRPRETPLADAILALPPLVDAQAEAHTLLLRGLLHALRSSEAAVRERIRRRIAVTLAIEHAALARVSPDRAVLRAFMSYGGDVQLAMPELLSRADATIDPRLAAAAVRQRQSLEALLPLLSGDSDVERSKVLRRLARWCAQPVVAFTQFNATSRAFYSHLRNHAGIALLGGTTAHITSGVIPRHEVIERLLDPRLRQRHDGVRLLITSDVLSEGLSLAGVATVVHLDLPWTAARVDQRVGRAARIGAPVPAVRVVRLPAGVPLQLHDALDRLVARKRRQMAVVDDAAPTDDAALIATLCAMVKRPVAPGVRNVWITMSSPRVAESVLIAIVRLGAGRCIVVLDDGGLRQARLKDWQALADGALCDTQRGSIATLRRALREYVADRELTQTFADVRDPRVHARRAADFRLTFADRVSHTADARVATASRQQLMLGAQRRDGDHTAVKNPRLDSAIRILAGVTIMPHSRHT